MLAGAGMAVSVIIVLFLDWFVMLTTLSAVTFTAIVVPFFFFAPEEGHLVSHVPILPMRTEEGATRYCTSWPCVAWSPALFTRQAKKFGDNSFIGLQKRRNMSNSTLTNFFMHT